MKQELGCIKAGGVLVVETKSIMVEVVLHTPSHPDQFAIEFSAGEYASSLKSLKAMHPFIVLQVPYLTSFICRLLLLERS